MSRWVAHLIWRHVYPLGFVGAQPEPRAAVGGPHRLRQLVGWRWAVVAG